MTATVLLCRTASIGALALAVAGLSIPPGPVASGQDGALTVRLTSPIGRTGMSGSTRIVARVVSQPGTVLGPVEFFVDGQLIGTDEDGPPYAIEWTDDNPFAACEIAVVASDSAGRTARDAIALRPFKLVYSTSISAVRLEASVIETTGRPVNGLTAEDFIVLEDGVRQVIDLALPDVAPATYTLLIDRSQSMSRRMDFVREAARQLPTHLRVADQVIVAPFSTTVGPITGPTRDIDTIVGVIDQIAAGGGTAILNALVTAAGRLASVDSRHILVLITDGYDENSDVAFERALDAVKATEATVYVIGIGGVAGISLRGEALLNRLAEATGGRAFFPARDFQLSDVHGLIAADVQQRYLVSYTPTNQDLDGMWRAVTLRTSIQTQVVRVRAGYYAPSPPPIRPQIELAIRDVNRQPVDIGIEDLVVFEDGVEQHLEAFQEATAPVSAILMLDSSGSMKRDAAAVIDAARTFVGALPARDRLAVLTFADRPVLVQDLSTDRDNALAAIGQYRAVGGTALYDALSDGLARLRQVEGRRVAVVLTDGRDENNPGTAPGSTHTLPDVIAALKDVGAIIFTIGLGPRVDQVTLEDLAQASGGEAYFPKDVSLLAADYRRVLEDLRRRFVVSYTSTNVKRDGGWRTVEVRSRRGGVIITSQGGYRAPEK